jgi:hypothetical protein
VAVRDEHSRKGATSGIHATKREPRKRNQRDRPFKRNGREEKTTKKEPEGTGKQSNDFIRLFSLKAV